jgi:hypothetical protein
MKQPSFQPSGSTLSLLVLIGYATTAARDAFLLFQSHGSAIADGPVLGLSVGGTIAGSLGIVLLLLFGSGAAVNIPLQTSLLATALGLLVLPLNSSVALTVTAGGLLTTFHVSQAMAAAQGKLSRVLVANFASSLLTIIYWIIFGIESSTQIAIGYIVGMSFQTFVSLYFGWSQRNGKTTITSDSAEMQLATAFGLALFAQGGWLLAKATYFNTAANELTSASFVINILASATVAIASPSTLLRVGGQKGGSNEQLRNMSLLLMSLLLAAFSLAFIFNSFLPISAETGLSIRRVSSHGMILSLSIPATCYLYIRTRTPKANKVAKRLQNFLLSGVLLQILLALSIRALGLPTVTIGIAFVLSQWTVALFDFRNMNSKGTDSPNLLDPLLTVETKRSLG